MALYAIGDLQGCYKSLSKLLEKIEFSPDNDQLWLAGDLVNRGPDSLSVLRWASRTKNVSCVLGNHDLWLLACAVGAKVRPSDTFQNVLTAKDKIHLVEWLRHQPFLRVHGQNALVHAGIWPGWDMSDAEKKSKELAAFVQSDAFTDWALEYKKYKGTQWQDSLSGGARFAALAAAFTRMRICDEAGKVDHSFTKTYAEIPGDYYAWFEVPDRKSLSHHIYFGHWAALGFYEGNKATCLDSGCVWGRELTAFDVEKRTRTSQASLE